MSLIDEHLEAQARKAQNQRYDATSGSFTELSEKETHYIEEATDEQKFRFFVGDGLDYKGQANTGFESKGGGVGAEFELDIAQLFLPGTPLTASTSLSGKVRNASHRFIAVMMMPEDITRTAGDIRGRNELPVSLFDMGGKMFELEVAIEAKVGVDLTKTGLGLFDAAEAVGVSIEAEVTAKAGGGYKYHTLMAHCVAPSYTRRGMTGGEFQRWVMAALRGESPTEMWAQDVRYFYGDQFKSSKWFNHFCSLQLSQHEGEGHAGVEASFSASYTPPGSPVSVASAGVGAEGGIAGTLKRRAYRLQTPAHNRVIVTQDTKIDYKRVATKVSAKLEAGIGLSYDDEDNSGLSAELPTPLKKEYEPEKEWAHIDSIGYESAVAVWSKEEPGRQLPGSGLVRGQSVLMCNLLGWYKNPTGRPAVEYMRTLTKALRVTPEQLSEALRGQPELEGLLYDIYRQAPDAALFIEAAFSVTQGNPSGVLNPALRRQAEESNMLVERAEKTGLRRVFSFSSTYHNRGYGRYPDVEAAYREVLADGDRYKNLECIRFRFYEDTSESNDETVFKLGIKFLTVLKLGFELEKVERVGTQRAWELHRHWFGPMSSYNPPKKSSKVWDYFDERGRDAWVEADMELEDERLRALSTSKSWREVYDHLKQRDPALAARYKSAMTSAFGKMGEAWRTHDSTMAPPRSVFLPTLLL